LKAAVIWQTETGKATSCVGVVCEELHCLVHTGCKQATGESGQDVQKKVPKQHRSKNPTDFTSLVNM